MPAGPGGARSRPLATLGPPVPARAAPRCVLRGPALSADDAVPDDLRYTAEHEWLRPGNGDTVRIGITAYAQEALGDIVFVTLPAVGTTLDAGQALGEVESTKSVSDVYAPLACTVGAVNEALDANPELVNTDPYGEGWLVELTVPGAAEALEGDGLLDAAAYRALLG